MFDSLVMMTAPKQENPVPFVLPPTQAILRLTRHQQVVCALAAAGYTDAEIAHQLQRALKTIHYHLHSAMELLNIHRRVLLARWWYSHEHELNELINEALLPPEPPQQLQSKTSQATLAVESPGE
jgi:DNA-binding NarL/FixJ family response regulator